MEMVSAAKMRRTVQKLLQTRPYAQTAWESIIRLAQRTSLDTNIYFKEAGEIKKIAIIVITSNRGLCGGFNNHVIKKARAQVELLHGENVSSDIIAIGRKAASAFAGDAYSLAADFERKDVTESIVDIHGVSHFVKKGYEDGTYQKVYIVYTEYVTALEQNALIEQVLPLDVNIDSDVEKSDDLQSISEYVLEPDAATLVNTIVPKIIDIKIYQAMLESDASEHSARMIAMKSAHDAAGDMIKSLKLIYNRARQASITQEISEISAGKAALES